MSLLQAIAEAFAQPEVDPEHRAKWEAAKAAVNEKLAPRLLNVQMTREEIIFAMDAARAVIADLSGPSKVDVLMTEDERMNQASHWAAFMDRLMQVVKAEDERREAAKSREEQARPAAFVHEAGSA